MRRIFIATIVIVIAALSVIRRPTLGGEIFSSNTLVNDSLVLIDRHDSTLDVVGPLSVGNVEGLAFDYMTNTMYGVDEATEQIVIVAQKSGALTFPYPANSLGIGNVQGLAFDSVTGTLYVNQFTQLYTVNLVTGGATPDVAITGSVGIYGLAFDDQSNTLYGLDDASDTVGSIGLTTGAYTPIASLPSPGQYRGLAYDRDANQLLVTDGDTPTLVEIDVASAQIAASNQLDVEFGVTLSGLTYSPDADLDNNGAIDVFDLLDVLAAWGDCPVPCPPTCVGDITNSTGSGRDCAVDVFDLLNVLANWS